MHIRYKLLIGPLILGVIVWHLDLGAVLGAIRGFHLQAFLAAVLVSLLGSVVSAVRWRIFIPEKKLAELLRLFFVGQLYSVLLPGQLAGEAVKAYRIAKGHTKKSRLVASVVVDRVIGTLALLALGVVGLWFSTRTVHPSITWSFGAVVLLLGMALGAMRVPAVAGSIQRGSCRLAMLGPSVARFSTALWQFTEVWRDHLADNARLVLALSLGALFQCLAVAIYVILGRDIGIDLALADWLWVAALASLAAIIPVSVAGIGVRDGALVGSLGYLGVAGERALALSLAVLALTLLGAIIGWGVEFSDRSSSGTKGHPPADP